MTWCRNKFGEEGGEPRVRSQTPARPPLFYPPDPQLKCWASVRYKIAHKLGQRRKAATNRAQIGDKKFQKWDPRDIPCFTRTFEMNNC